MSARARLRYLLLQHRYLEARLWSINAQIASVEQLLTDEEIEQAVEDTSAEPNPK
jgi:hypothetical protein